jgi:peptide/nickel transport system substrate-binding protein
VILTVHVSQCLIATATYGSELAPQVQFLKAFRDQQITRTFAGTNFMIAFNAWYYSFSPAVAQYENANPTARVVAKVVLYPIINILHLSSSTFSLLGFEPELAALAAGLLAGSLVGLVYLTPPTFVVLWLARRRIGVPARRKVLRLLASWFALMLVGFIISEVLISPLAMMVASSGLALAALTIGSLLPGLVFLSRLERKT